MSVDRLWRPRKEHPGSIRFRQPPRRHKNNNGPIQPFGNCGFPGGLYLTSAPIIAVN
jgi:hypothetical protein